MSAAEDRPGAVPAHPDGYFAEGGASQSRRLGYHFNAGFLTQTQVRRILTLAGYDLRIGTPDAAGL